MPMVRVSNGGTDYELTQKVATVQNHTSSYTIPYTFELDKWYMIMGVYAAAPSLTFTGFEVYGSMAGTSSASYYEHGARVYFGKATSPTVKVAIPNNYTVIVVGELTEE